MKKSLTVLISRLLCVTACKRSGSDAKELFIVKGRLIDKCSGGGIPALQKLEIYNEFKVATVGSGISNPDGTFLIRCDLHHPYNTVYMLFKNDHTSGKPVKVF